MDIRNINKVINRKDLQSTVGEVKKKKSREIGVENHLIILGLDNQKNEDTFHRNKET